MSIQLYLPTLITQILCRFNHFYCKWYGVAAVSQARSTHGFYAQYKNSCRGSGGSYLQLLSRLEGRYCSLPPPSRCTSPTCSIAITGGPRSGPPKTVLRMQARWRMCRSAIGSDAIFHRSDLAEIADELAVSLPAFATRHDGDRKI